jgi:hypothetical protein
MEEGRSAWQPGQASCCRLKSHSRHAPATLLTYLQTTRLQCVRTLTVVAASLNNLRYEPNTFLHLNLGVPVGLFKQVIANTGKKVM